MPQDSMRNAVYRSLVTCSDPNGVVEYKTMRKSKSSSRKGQQKTEELGAPKASNRSSEGIKEKSQVPLPSSILEVSRGAQKLNLMLDSWSERRSYDGQSKDITRDLLKGALDLQESLVMLCKLQEPSKCSSQMKPGHGKNYQGGIDGVGVGRNDSDRFTEKSKCKEIDSGRPSFDGSSKNSVEELKKVIRDSLTRQNLLSNPFTEESDNSFAPRKSNNFSDIPSTSSSQSSALYSSNSASMDWSVASTSKEVKAENISLIAKLMGLEGFPTEKTPSHLRWQNSKRCLDIPRSIDDIERPNASYSSSNDRKSETKTLKEVIDTMHLKGLLRSNDLEELEQNPRTSCDSCSKEDDIQFSPIVVMKPLRFPCKDREDSLPRNSSQESVYNSRKLESREESSIRRYYQTERAPRLINAHNKWEVKEELQNGASLGRKEALSIRRVSDKMQKTKETSIRRYTREQAALSKEKEENNMRMGRVKKVMRNEKVPAEMENAKSVTMLRSADHVKPNSTKASKRDSGPIITKRLMQQKNSLIHNPTLKSKPASSIDQVKNVLTSKVKAMTESTRTTSVTKRSRPKHVDRNNHTNKVASVPTVTNSDLEDQLCTTGSKETSVQMEDPGEQQKSPLREVPMEACQDGSIIESAEELEHFVDLNVKIEEAVQSAINQKELLPSSSQSFLSFAEDHFELHINQQTAQKPALTLEALDMINPILFLDCANELMECQRQRILLAGYHLFWIPAINVRTRIYPQQLLGEVCEGINKLKNYFKVDGDTPGKDGIGRMLESDIMCKLPITGDLWNLGWEYGSSMNEVDQVLGEVQEQVLNELIEEITVDYYETMVDGLRLA